MEKRNSKAFYVVKAFAILSVIFAHCTYSGTPTVQAITDLLGGIGVPIFLASAAVFFNEKEDWRSFWFKKLKNIVCPWILFGVITYLGGVFLGGNGTFGIVKLLHWCIGYGSWMYFVTILLMCYAIFRAIRWDGLPYVMIALFLLSNILDVFGINPITNLIGSYLNVFTRIGYFAIGILLKKASVMKLETPKLWIKLSLSAFAVVMGVLCIVLDVPVLSYFIHLSFILSVGSSLFFWSQSLADCKLLEGIGKQTYFIYFVHMQIGNAVLNLIMKLAGLPAAANWMWLIVKPVAILFFIYAIAVIAVKVAALIKLDKLKWLAGLR